MIRSTLTCGFTFVRHGETSYNKKGILQGQAVDLPLSDTGLQQAEAAGRYLKDVKISSVYVSDMLRAQQTAEAILKNNALCSALPMNSDSLLKERSFGTIEGRPMKELRELAKAAGQTFLDFTPPGGETKDQVKERFKAFWEKALQQIGDEHWDAPRGTESELTFAQIQASVKGEANDGLRDVPVHALVVTHGAYMCEAVRYFVEELDCSIPQLSDKSHMISLSPNTGLCRFLVTLKREDGRVGLAQIHCVFIHRADHLKVLQG